MKKRKIVWDKQTLHYFREAIQYIRKDSPQNADKVKSGVLVFYAGPESVAGHFRI